jgi:primosomal protein N'
VNLRDWLRNYAQPATVNLRYKGLFTVVLCGLCGKIMTGPFDGHGWWEYPELSIRKFHRCEHCGTKNRVSKGFQLSIDHNPEEP